jgi:2-hydroxy-6-oxonona-2,4-dienedioate hydrolase
MVMTNEKYVDVNGIRTRYFEKGEGEPLVLFHGGNFGYLGAAVCAANWDLNFDGLTQWFHVYAVDKLGQGHTDNPKSDDDYTMSAVVRHAYEFLETKGLQNVHLVGSSRGGYLVARLTLEHPGLVKSCIITDSESLSPPVGEPYVRATPPEPHGSKESQRWSVQRASFKFDHISDELLDAMTQVAMLPKYRETVAKMETEGLKDKLFLPLLKKDKDETLSWIRDGRLKTPTLLIWGYNDKSAPLQMGLALFDLIAASEPRSQMHIFNQCGHWPYREHPLEFNQVVRSFIHRF